VALGGGDGIGIASRSSME